MVKNNKAQMKIQQMSFMLIAVTLFFALVGVGVVVVKFSDLKDTATSLEEENAILLVSKLANSPEFSCGESFGTLKTNCIDFDKVMMLKENIGEYEELWDVSNIEIRKIYPEQNKEISCTSRNYPDCNYIKLIDKKSTGFDYSNFVALCRKEQVDNRIETKCELGKIFVRYEVVE